MVEKQRAGNLHKQFNGYRDQMENHVQELENNYHALTEEKNGLLHHIEQMQDAFANMHEKDPEENPEEDPKVEESI